jgi:hypothetical protein
MTRWLVALGFALFASLMAGLLGQIGLVQTLELKTYDARMRAVATGAGARRRSRWCSSTITRSASSNPPWAGGVAAPAARHAHRLLARGRQTAVYDVQFSEADRPRATSWARRGRARSPTTRSSRR